jgi:hypothetical protein
MSNAKQALKNIVKECLLEILSEGLNEGIRRKDEQKKPAVRSEIAKNNKLMEAKAKSSIDEAINNVTDDDVMRSILADTAKRTLSEQLQHESHLPQQNSIMADIAPQNAGIDVNSMFSEAASNWSQMAFGNAKKNL